MGKPQRKPRPSPPRWYWWDSDNCWACKNRNNCNQCKTLKKLSVEVRKRRERIEKNRITKGREELE